MAASDVFVLLDDVQFPRGKAVANRARLRGPNGYVETAASVSIPKGQEGKASYRELGLAGGKWRKKLLKTLEMSYGKEPFFDELFPVLEELLQMEDFCGMNLAFIHRVRDMLGLDTQLYVLSELDSIREGKLERIFDLCERFGATRYLSGQGAAKYNEPERFQAHGIELAYTSKPVFDEPVMDEAVEEGLSIVDPLFRIGSEKTGEELEKAIKG
jgi:hypothetical protein